MMKPGLLRTSVRSGWRRLLIKNRRRRALSAPVVRFLLPLTQPLEEGPVAGGASPILLMLEGTWSSEAGPVERVEAQIVAAERTYQKKLRDEIGYDPIDNADEFPVDPHGKARVRVCVGDPVGLGFEPEVSAPLLGTTCHTLTVEPLEDASAVPPWTFVKLRFRRVASGAGCLVEKKGENGGPDEPVTPPSDWTDGVWVQLLPDSRAFADVNGNLHKVANMRLGADKKLYEGEARVELAQQNDPSKPRQRWLFLVVTERVVDAGGRRDSERWLAFGCWRGGNAPFVFWSARDIEMPEVPDSEQKYRVRLMEVERHRQFDQDELLWDTPSTKPLRNCPLVKALFPDPEVEAQDRRQARIVRISPPLGESDKMSWLAMEAKLDVQPGQHP